MTRQTRLFKIVFSLILAAVLEACAAGKQLPTVPAGPSEIQGTYTLLLYGCHYPEDIKDAAFLIPEGSKYRFEIYDLDTSYKTETGLPADRALIKAESFIRCSMRKFSQSQLRRITDTTGETVGYELRPLYFPLEFGQMDVMRITYSIQQETVRAYIRLDPDVERQIENQGNRRNGGKL